MNGVRRNQLRRVDFLRFFIAFDDFGKRAAGRDVNDIFHAVFPRRQQHVQPAAAVDIEIMKRIRDGIGHGLLRRVMVHHIGAHFGKNIAQVFTIANIRMINRDIGIVFDSREVFHRAG